MSKKLGLFKGIDDKIAQLLFRNRLTSEEVCQVIKRENGIELNPGQIAFIKKKKKEWMQKHSGEIESDFLLDSIDKNILKFENLFDRFEVLANKFQDSGDDFRQMLALREMKDMLRMSIKRLEEYKNKLEHQPKTVTINNTQVMNFIKESQQKWFKEMDVELTPENKLVFHAPSQDLIDEYIKWKAGK